MALALGPCNAIDCNLLLVTRMVTQDLTQNDHNYNKNSGSILVTFLELSKNKQKFNNLVLNGNHIPYVTYVSPFRTILATELTSIDATLKKQPEAMLKKQRTESIIFRNNLRRLKNSIKVHKKLTSSIKESYYRIEN